MVYVVLLFPAFSLQHGAKIYMCVYMASSSAKLGKADNRTQNTYCLFSPDIICGRKLSQALMEMHGTATIAIEEGKVTTTPDLLFMFCL